eukprot:1218392-Rhodomonas_salina.3
MACPLRYPVIATAFVVQIVLESSALAFDAGHTFQQLLSVHVPRNGGWIRTDISVTGPRLM